MGVEKQASKQKVTFMHSDLSKVRLDPVKAEHPRQDIDNLAEKHKFETCCNYCNQHSSDSYSEKQQHSGPKKKKMKFRQLFGGLSTTTKSSSTSQQPETSETETNKQAGKLYMEHYTIITV